MGIMKTRILLAAAVGFFFAASASAIANADTRKAGDSLSYEITKLVRHTPPPGLPKELVAASKKREIGLTLTFSVAIDRVDSDGSAHATMTSHFALPRSVHIPNPDGRFEGSVLPDGQIVPKYDSNITTAAIEKFQSTRGHIYSPSAEEVSNLAAFRLSDWLSLFNDVALGAGKRKAFQPGDAWRLVVADKNNELVNFSVTGTQSYRGHDVVVLAVDSAETTAKGIRTSKGTAYYDPQQSALIGIHVEMEGDLSENTDSVGNDASGETLDINLQP